MIFKEVLATVMNCGFFKVFLQIVIFFSLSREIKVIGL